MGHVVCAVSVASPHGCQCRRQRQRQRQRRVRKCSIQFFRLPPAPTPPISMQRRPGNPESSMRLLNIEHVYVFPFLLSLSFFCFACVCLCLCECSFFTCPARSPFGHYLRYRYRWHRVHSLTHSLSHLLLSLSLCSFFLRLLSPFTDPSRASACVCVCVCVCVPVCLCDH